MFSILSKIAVRLGVFLVAGYLSPFILFFANLVPLMGVLFFDWNTNDILLIYIFETGIILFFALLKVIFLQIAGKNDVYMDHLTSEQLRHSSLSIFLSDIFAAIKNPIVATFVCLVGIGGLLYSILFLSLLSLDKEFMVQEPIAYTLSGSNQDFLIALVVIVIEHFILFISNFLLGKEYNYFHPFATPLKRIVLLLIAMIIMIELNEVNQGFVYLAALIFLKMLGELYLLNKEKDVRGEM